MKADVESVGGRGRDEIWHRLQKTPGLFWWAFLVSLSAASQDCLGKRPFLFKQRNDIAQKLRFPPKRTVISDGQTGSLGEPLSLEAMSKVNTAVRELALGSTGVYFFTADHSPPKERTRYQTGAAGSTPYMMTECISRVVPHIGSV